MWRMSALTRYGTVENLFRETKILRGANGNNKKCFPCLADHDESRIGKPFAADGQICWT